MKITIVIKQEVEIDAAELPSLAQTVRKNWGMEGGEPVYMADILKAAHFAGLVVLDSLDFEVDAEWEEALTDEEIAGLKDD